MFYLKSPTTYAVGYLLKKTFKRLLSGIFFLIFFNSLQCMGVKS